MKRSFKILSLISALIFLSNLLNAQTPDAKEFVGYWTTEGSTVRLVFFIDKNEKLQLIEWSSEGCEEMEIMEMNVIGNTIKTKERFKSANHITYNEYVLIDEFTIKNIIKGDADTTIYYKRLK